MHRTLIPLTLVAALSTGVFASAAIGPAPGAADGPCAASDPSATTTPTPVESTPAESTPTDAGSLDDRCEIDPESYVLNYESPATDEDASVANAPPMTTPAPSGSGGVATADQTLEVVGEPRPTWEPGPLDDNVFVDAGDSMWVETESDRESTFALDVDTGSFRVAQQFLAEGYLPEPDSIRPEEWVNAFGYGDEPAVDDELAVTVDAAGQGPDGTSLVRLGITTMGLDPVERPAANITFVIDASGSMDIRERLGMVQASLALLVKNLRPDDTIAIVTYGDVATPVLSPTPVSEWRQIVAAIDSLRPNGSTNMEAGLVLGYDEARANFDPERINVVVLASDGVANQGVTDPEVLTQQITQSGEQGIHLVTVGYGMGNYNDHLMEQLADQGDGFYSYIDTFEEAERLFVEELTPTLYVVAEEAKVQVVFDPEVVAAYRLIGYENRALDDDQFTDDTVDAGELGAGHHVSALYEVELVDGAAPTDVIGEVKLRWQSPNSEPDSDDVSEISQDIVIGAADASPTLRLASLVAHTAELLKGNTVVTERDITLADLLDEAVALEALGVDGADDMVDFLETALESAAPIPSATIED